MNDIFFDRDNRGYNFQKIVELLRKIKADECDHLFLHSDIMLGRLAGGLKRNEYLENLYSALLELGVKNLIIPTYTYSFNNGEDYDVKTSKSCIGALNEYIRKNRDDNFYRTLDPLLSVSVNRDLEPLFNHPSDHSLGEGCDLDVIHHLKDVKFLFFGIHMRDCFTYLHHIEKMLDVPYRFDIEFEGNITDYDGNTYHKKQSIHTRLKGVKLAYYTYFEQYLIDKGFEYEEKLGDKTIACISEKDVYREIVDAIHKDPNYFLDVPFDPNTSTKEYTYGLNGERITHC